MPPKKAKSQGVRSETVSGVINVELSGAATGAGEYADWWNINPSNLSWNGSTVYGGAKLAAFADLFQFYRFTRMHAKLVCVNSFLGAAAYSKTNMVMGACAYNVTAPSSFAMISDLPQVSPLAIAQAGAGTNAQLVQLPPEGVGLDLTPSLRNLQTKWWRTVANGSVDDTLEFQARLVVGAVTSVASQTVRPSLQISYTCEFKDFISASLTPADPANDAKLIRGLEQRGYSVLHGARKVLTEQKSESGSDLVDVGLDPMPLERGSSMDLSLQLLESYDPARLARLAHVLGQAAAHQTQDSIVPPPRLSSARK